MRILIGFLISTFLGLCFLTITYNKPSLPLPLKTVSKVIVKVKEIPEKTKQPDILDYIWYKESKCGTDLSYKEIKETGEVGEYQIRPIFIEDVFRISGYWIDPDDSESCRKGILIWLNHYLSRVSTSSLEDEYQLYRRGASGYRRWKKL